MNLIRDTRLQFGRALRLSMRSPSWLAIGLLQPVLYLLLFGPLLDGVPGGGAYNTLVPGLLILTAMFAGMAVSFALIGEMRNGVIERMRVTPTSRAAMLLGRALRDVVLLLIQGAILVLVAIPFGLDIPLYGALAGLGVLAVAGFALSGLLYALALAIGSEDAFAQLTNILSLPLMLLAGVLLPLSLAPAWLRAAGEVNPLTHTLEAIRAMFAGNFAASEIWVGLAVTVGAAVLCTAVGIRAFARAAR